MAADEIRPPPRVLGSRRLATGAVLGGLIVAATVGVVCFGLPSTADVRAVTAAAGWAAPLAFAVGYAALAMTPVPASVLTIAAGVLFGVPVGLTVVVLGAVTGAVAAFWLSRHCGRAIVAAVDVDRVRRLDTMLARHGFLAVVAVRLVPLLPFGALSYACGLTAVRPRDFVAGTVIGIVPGAAAYVTIGAYGAQPGSAPLLTAIGALGLLVVGGSVVTRRRNRRVSPSDAG